MLRHFQLFWEILDRKNKKIFLGLLVINIFNSLIEVISLGALFPIIFSLLAPDSLNTVPLIKNFLDNYAPVRGKNFILLSLFIVMLGFVLKNIFYGFVIWFKNYFLEKITFTVHQNLFIKYMFSSYPIHIKRNTAEVIRNITQCTMSFKNNYLFTLLEMITHISIGIAYLIFLSYVDIKLMIYFIIIMLIVMFIIAYKIKNISIHLAQKINVLDKENNHYILLGLMGFKEIKVLMKESFFINKVNHLIEAYKKTKTYSVFISQLPRLIIETVVVFLGISSIIILFKQEQPSQLIIAKLGVFAFAAIKVFPMFSFLSSAFTNLVGGGVSLEIIHQELLLNDSENRKEIDPSPTRLTSKLLPFKKSIELRNICFHFNEPEKNILDGINLVIPKKSIIGLVGESGSGKTTLVDVIIGLVSPEQGEVWIDDKLRIEKGVWNDRIGYIPQQIYLANTSLKENIALGWEKESIDEKQIWKVLETAQLADMVRTLPQGIDTEIGEAGIRLSGGQKQRVGIARALYIKPELLILDEATSALDNRTEMDFVKCLKSLNNKTTQIIIAHRLTTVKHCDIIYVLHKGRIVEKGTYSQLERSGKYFRKMLLKDLYKKQKKFKKI